MIKIRKIKKKDFKNINRLFFRNNLKFFNKSEWNNLWSNPYFKKNKNWAIGWAATNKNRIVGHIGNTPRVYLTRNNKKIICSNINSWVVDKDYRYLSVLLLKKVLDFKKSHFRISTTTSTSAAEIFKKFDINEVIYPKIKKNFLIIFNFKKILNIYAKTKNPIISSSVKLFNPLIIKAFKKRTNLWEKKEASLNIVQLKNFAKSYDLFWKKYFKQNQNKLILNRSSIWQKWLLKESIKKGNTLVFCCQRKNTILGYSIIKIISKKKYKYARLIDLVTLNDDKKIINELILKNLYMAKKLKCDFFEFRFISKKIFSEIKKFKPYVYNLKENNFYLNYNENLKKMFFSKNLKWDPSNLDGDIINTL